MVNLFKKHPNYNGKYQIVFDCDYTRCCNKDELYNFADWMYHQSRDLFLVPIQIGKFSYAETKNIYTNINYVKSYMQDIYNLGYRNISVNGRSLTEMEKENKIWEARYYRYKYNDEVYITNGCAYDKKKFDMIDKIYKFKYKLAENTDHIATEEFASIVNEYFPGIKAVAGQKVSRIVNKICKSIGLDKHSDYNREFAKYSDAINPLTIKRHTVLSCHPVDYLTMSFGNSWASCHTIDKKNRREMPDDYSGCYSSGTLSYMLDGSSFVYYTVDKEYNGNELELQDKINRNMFHMGEDKLIQARVYPQSTDGETGIYRQIREIAQKVISDCLEVPNMWKNVKGTSECGSMIYSYGTHYRDYKSFEYCNVSYLKGDTEDINRNGIKVGHNPICVNCGDNYDWAEAVECEGCHNGEHKCHDCGYSYETDDMHYIDGHWYCNDCCFYCEYHEEYEIGESTYVEGFGRVCDDSLYIGEFYECEYCNEWHYTESRHDEHIETEDGTHFCCADHALNGGYEATDDGYWYPEDEFHYCEHCDRHVHENDWNDELECCTDCEEEVSAENEVIEELEEEIREAV